MIVFVSEDLPTEFAPIIDTLRGIYADSRAS